MAASIRQRGEYSKNGCKECKRRKIKCDEFVDPPKGVAAKINAQGRPSCWQCTRLGKECVYPRRGERVARVSRKAMMSQSMAHASTMQDVGVMAPSVSTTVAAHATARNAVSVSPHVPPAPQTSQAPYASQAQPVTQSESVGLLSSGLNFPSVSMVPGNVSGSSGVSGVSGVAGVAGSVAHIPPLIPPTVPHPVFGASELTDSASLFNISPWRPYDHGDLTGLATDLNNLVSEMSERNHPTPPTPISEGSSSEEAKRHRAPDAIPHNILLDSIQVNGPQEHMFLQRFYHEFANIILPFQSYDPIAQSYFNPARDILLKSARDEPFLLAAILAQGARSCYAQSALPEDEEAHYHYLSRCLKLLGPALGETSEKAGSQLVSNIESVLLTVLLLASSNAANPKQNWRPHLKGAKDLLIKHTASRGAVGRSKVLVFCKYWFISFEILAGLGSRLGGTVHSERELDILLNCSDPLETHILTELGVLLPNGFNILGGYHNDCIHSFRDIIKLLNKARDNPMYERSETSEYVRILGSLHTQMQFEFLNRSGIFSTSQLPLPTIPQGLLLERLPGAHDNLFISWMDTSQQTYLLAATLIMLTNFLCLPMASPQVQSLTTKLTTLLNYATVASRTSTVKHVIMMVQWPALVAGLHAVGSSDKIVVGDVLRFATRVGAGSASHTLARLERFWMHAGKGDTEPEDHIDVVNY
ncbi:putative lysine biosynthesis regulatory protein [Clavispora lusitaniae]|uniref:Lysine biosynthesis regulatory protein n=1 Tax=Clavispora lusitaniae TaxID=36911 RepID=A0ACD0WQA6_CLALS|nr:putative lysine biosynthesis regulatory protein [Clavispora lusitaniae]QFZ35413.1 putative lysine biosynthesis regulatory protein [Clavispora lusitaniae]QFZ41107.1 putative lysine biosynthesis regulatory protein [Clavispora lusitaniae]QFZ46788.1 putative lysine biosynthesis regulatory protein [Clavispora lusitaniae]QFZ52453.1 putative lysine biosynthesis regulatory protein [Clavispora lusitaniae]